jgi:hypothetical protein
MRVKKAAIRINTKAVLSFILLFLPVPAFPLLPSSEPALRRNPVLPGINPLRSTNGPGKGDHTGDIDPDRTIAAAAEHAISPDDSFDSFQKLPVHGPLLLI